MNGGALVLTVPLPPTTNNAYSQGRNGRRFLVQSGKDYKADIHDRVKIFSQGWRPTGKLRLTIGLVFPDNRRADISNRIKLLEDALAEALGFDDRDIWQLYVWRSEPDKLNSRCEVRLEEIGSKGP